VRNQELTQNVFDPDLRIKEDDTLLCSETRRDFVN